jgi:hypothetical protein
MFVQPELGFRNWWSERLREGFLRNRPGSLNRRIRHDVTDCNDGDDRDSEYNDRSDGELRDAASPLVGMVDRLRGELRRRPRAMRPHFFEGGPAMVPNSGGSTACHSGMMPPTHSEMISPTVPR